MVLLAFVNVYIIMSSKFNYRVQCEVDEVLSDKNYVSPEDLEKLEYTEQVL